MEVVPEQHVEWARQVALSQMHTWPLRAREEGLNAAMLALVEAARTYRPGGAATFRTYAHHRIRGAVVDHVRRELGRYWRPSSWPLHLSKRLPDWASSAALEAVERRVDRAQLVAAIERLEPRPRLMVVWHYWYGMSLREMGEVWGFTESRASQVMTQALERLRWLLDPWGLHGG
jgi:RNA polymerase sigma factor (sigma-70 family)